MTNGLFYLPCLPNINWLQNFVKYENRLLESEENFVKSSFRNRYEIAGANGRQILSIPLAGGRDHHRPYKHTRIANTGHWQKKHWQAICSAYGSTPFFEHYAHKFQPFYEQQYELLYDFNLALLQVVLKSLRLPDSIPFTTVYEKEVTDKIDLRSNKVTSPVTYYQVFAERHGFIPNLCALDLIFNEGNRSKEIISF